MAARSIRPSTTCRRPCRSFPCPACCCCRGGQLPLQDLRAALSRHDARCARQRSAHRHDPAAPRPRTTADPPPALSDRLRRPHHRLQRDRRRALSDHAHRPLPLRASRGRCDNRGGYRRVEPGFRALPRRHGCRGRPASTASACWRRCRLISPIRRSASTGTRSWRPRTTGWSISLAMVCPFEAKEKQALLEAAELAERSRVMTALLELRRRWPGRRAPRH